MACAKNCPTRDHATYGACLRSKGFQLNGLQSLGGDRTAQKAWDRELDTYREARSYGLQPKTTKLHDTRAAMEAAS